MNSATNEQLIEDARKWVKSPFRIRSSKHLIKTLANALEQATKDKPCIRIYADIDDDGDFCLDFGTKEATLSLVVPDADTGSSFSSLLGIDGGPIDHIDGPLSELTGDHIRRVLFREGAENG